MSVGETPLQRATRLQCSGAEPDPKRPRIDGPNSPPALAERTNLVCQLAAPQTAVAAQAPAACANAAVREQRQKDCAAATAMTHVPTLQRCQARTAANQLPASRESRFADATSPLPEAQHDDSAEAHTDSQASAQPHLASNGGDVMHAAGRVLAQQHLRSAEAASAAQRSRRLRSFYGSPGQTAVELRIQRFLQGVKLRLRPSVPYKVFPQQAAAFEFADAQADDRDLRILSVELGVKGARHFVATTYDEFWARYRSLDSAARHHYEIIREGQPCNLYFDLEFIPDFNAGAKGDALVDALLSDVSAALWQLFDLRLDSPTAVLELDSSTPAKFSRHVVVRLPGAAFETNRDAGAFVAQLLGGDALDGPYAVMKDAAGARTCFVDMSVYSRNRAFRLFLSSKAGKQATLQPTGRLAAVAGSQKDVFMGALICNVPPGCRLLRCDASGAAPAWRSVKRPASRARGTISGSQANRPPSPFPAIDAFLAAVCTQDGSQGFVRSWTAVDSSVILYGIGGSRWCGNIGRQHKSNGVYIVVDLAAGQWWQKCFDSDCGSYRSEAAPLPPGVAPPPPRRGLGARRSNEGVLEGEDVPGGSDAALAAAAAEAEADHACLAALLEWEQS